MCRDKTLRPATGLAFLLAASLAPACYFPNVEAVKVKMLDECGVAPNGPWCACDDSNSDGCDVVVERYVSKNFDSADEQACFLNVDCSGDSTGGEAEALVECVEDDSGSPLDVPREPECVNACYDVLFDCEKDGCSRPGVEECFRDFDACKSACPARL